MKRRQPVGLLKFFGRDDHLDSLFDGVVHFTAPEVYRMDGHEGRGDPQESCSTTFRIQPGGSPLQMKFGEQEFQVLALTVHNAGRKPGHLHCWCAIEIPENREELQQLIDDINRMRSDFGSRYVFLLADRIDAFVERIQQGVPSGSNKALDHSIVEYSARQDEWGVFCKAETYAYQREYRFVLGECEHMETRPEQVRCPGNFHEILHVEPTIRIYGQTENDLLLVLDKTGCRMVLRESLEEVDGSN